MVPSLTARGYLRTRKLQEKQRHKKTAETNCLDSLSARFMVVFQRSAGATAAKNRLIKEIVKYLQPL